MGVIIDIIRERYTGRMTRALELRAAVSEARWEAWAARQALAARHPCSLQDRDDFIYAIKHGNPENVWCKRCRFELGLEGDAES